MQSTPDWILFFGRFHPLIVHFPIGLLVMGGFLAWLGRKPKWKALKEAVPVVWLGGALGATLAVILGLMLAEGGGYEESTLDWHKWLGIGVAVLAWGTWALRSRPKLYLGGLISSLLLLLGAGHNGGNLTHGSDYLVQYAPNPVRALAGMPPKEEAEEVVAWEDAEVFAHVIQPLLKQRCVSCHNPRKIKGGLRMDTREMLLAGGDNGPIWVAGNVDESEIIRRLHLPKSDEEHMPPRGKKPLSDEQIEVLEWWIAQGAEMDSKVASADAPETVQAYFASQIGEGAASGGGSTMPKKATPQIDIGAVAELSQIPGMVIQPISQSDALWQVRVMEADSGLTDLQPLLPVASSVKLLDLSKSGIADFSQLDQFKELTHLHLEHSQVDDAALAQLNQLPNLIYLNLFNTAVSDAALPHLQGLTKLQQLYLWQTQVTEKGAATLRQQLPDCEINMGIVL